DKWTLVLDGQQYSHDAAQGESLMQIAQALANAVTGDVYRVTPSGNVVAVSKIGGGAVQVGASVLHPGATGQPLWSQGTGTMTISGTMASSLTWSQAVISMSGLANIGEVWTIAIGGATYSYTVEAGDDVPSRVAQH